MALSTSDKCSNQSPFQCDNVTSERTGNNSSKMLDEP